MGCVREYMDMLGGVMYQRFLPYTIVFTAALDDTFGSRFSVVYILDQNDISVLVEVHG